MFFLFEGQIITTSVPHFPFLKWHDLIQWDSKHARGTQSFSRKTKYVQRQVITDKSLNNRDFLP